MATFKFLYAAGKVKTIKVLSGYFTHICTFIDDAFPQSRDDKDLRFPAFRIEKSAKTWFLIRYFI